MVNFDLLLMVSSSKLLIDIDSFYLNILHFLHYGANCIYIFQHIFANILTLNISYLCLNITVDTVIKML